ncbi:uncharacterized protein LOC123412071 isoform X2 [Hordeum vulgare subsp. vulgare]|uniref:uncharacterized protein LOC123412071 isoform X2 n=1 Tax=Hordeum vulgare subsp. vulgare TaxID=112509 RepID=UPI001D1A3D60|nr:uncharacterized protein LOC123412071 isoform X2 [Hordeum vulgare subsp. vulgare]
MAIVRSPTNKVAKIQFSRSPRYSNPNHQPAFPRRRRRPRRPKLLDPTPSSSPARSDRREFLDPELELAGHRPPPLLQPCSNVAGRSPWPWSFIRAIVLPQVPVMDAAPRSSPRN